MGDHFVQGLVTVASAIVGVAIIAVLVSQHANTSSVISSAGNAFANDLTAAVAPVSGASASVNTSSSNSGFSGLGAPISSLNF
jgi:PRD1 phage membrane DNA delivery